MLENPITLNDWYVLLNYIYMNKNFYRSRESIYSHLVEVVGALSPDAIEKNKVDSNAINSVAKALGWWFSICGKIGIQSVEEMIWVKFPYICPYCFQIPHQERDCKRSVRGSKEIDWRRLADFRKQNEAQKPSRMRDWQVMFDRIYTGATDEPKERIFGRLSQEVGELAEGNRLLPVSHAYFMNEAADVFAWLMRYANHEDIGNGELGVKLERALTEEYPGRCRHCGGKECRCQPILYSTLGRLARAMPPEAFQHRRDFALFTHDQMVDNIRIGEEKIKIGNQEYKLTTELLLNIVDTNYKILAEFNKKSIEIPASLKDILQLLNSLASNQKLTQQSIDEALEIIKQTPSEAQSIVSNFLLNISGSLWATAILHVLKGG